MTKVKIKPNDLRGSINIPPSKSFSHRAVIAASLCDGQSKVTNLLFSEDINATCDAMQNFGAHINRYDDSIDIFGSGKVRNPIHPIDCHESGSTLRFLVPFGGIVEEPVVFKGRGKLTTRPLNPYFDIFDNQDIRYVYNDSLPLVVDGELKSGKFEIPGDVSSQFITGLLYTLPLLDGDSEIIITSPLESKGYIDMTLEVLRDFSIDIKTKDHKSYFIKGNQTYKSKDYRVEGDFSQAAFWIVAGLLGGDLNIKNLNVNSLQGDKEVLDIVKRMQANIEISEESIKVVKTRTKGTIIDGSQCPDIIPVLAVLAALSEGSTEIINASRLRIKESDRLKAICTELNKLGAHIIEKEDGLVIHGKEELEGGIVDSWNDHRIAMSLAIASIKCKNEVIISNSHAINKSYPHFYDDFASLGGYVSET